MYRPKKSQAIVLVSEKAPEYVEFFREFQSYDGGWLIWPEFLLRVKANLKLDNYVLLYEDYRKINVCLFLFLMGEDGWKQWNDDLKNLSQEDQLATIEEFAQDLIDDDGQWLAEMIGEIPASPEEESEAKSLFEAMSQEEQVFLQKRASFLFLHILSAIHNYFSIMVNGEMMTSLVPKAMTGDQEAFCKAVKIDRNLITSHPYFKSRYEEAQANGEREFLRRISVNQTSPHLLGKIRYPGLYIVFAMLDALKWLDDLTANEILDICDAARLDRFQNRIEDTVAVNKQLARYRRYQKTGGVSMH
jgi:hypothetical protein